MTCWWWVLVDWKTFRMRPLHDVPTINRPNSLGATWMVDNSPYHSLLSLAPHCSSVGGHHRHDHAWNVTRSTRKKSLKIYIHNTNRYTSVPNCSGVTKVGVIRGGNWWCRPRLFFPQKWPFLVIALCNKWFLANVNSSSCSLFVIDGPSVCLSSVCLSSVCRL